MRHEVQVLADVWPKVIRGVLKGDPGALRILRAVQVDVPAPKYISSCDLPAVQRGLEEMEDQHLLDAEDGEGLVVDLGSVT